MAIVRNIKGPVGNTGSTGTTGATGSTGLSGTAFLTGSGVPSNGLGNNGDTYLNLTNGDMYTKSAVAW